MTTKARPDGQPKFVAFGDAMAPVIGELIGEEFVLYDDVSDPPPAGGALVAPAEMTPPVSAQH